VLPPLRNAVGDGAGKKKPEGYESVTVPPTRMSPDTLGANTSVAELLLLPATRSDKDTVKAVNATPEPMGPLSNKLTPTALASCDVLTLIELRTLTVELPIVKPLSVTVKAAEAGTTPACTVKTIKFAVCEVQVMLAALLDNTEGVGEVAKKFAGWLNVMVPDAGTAPPALGENTNVAAQPGLLV
jgi:hypothetical protein